MCSPVLAFQGSCTANIVCPQLGPLHRKTSPAPQTLAGQAKEANFVVDSLTQKENKRHRRAKLCPSLYIELTTGPHTLRYWKYKSFSSWSDHLLVRSGQCGVIRSQAWFGRNWCCPCPKCLVSQLHSNSAEQRRHIFSPQTSRSKLQTRNPTRL
jgi:hypothetical protein